MGFAARFLTGLLTGGATEVAKNINIDVARRKDNFEKTRAKYENEFETFKINRRDAITASKNGMETFKKLYDPNNRLNNRELYALSGTQDLLSNTMNFIEKTLTDKEKEDPAKIAERLKKELGIKPDLNSNINKMSLEQVIASNLPRFQGIRPKALSNTTAYGLRSNVTQRLQAEFDAQYPADKDPTGLGLTSELRQQGKVVSGLKMPPGIKGRTQDRVDVVAAIKARLGNIPEVRFGGGKYSIIPEFEGYSDLPTYNKDIQLVTDKGTETVAVGSTRHNQLQRLHKLEAVKLYLKSSENLNLTSDAFNMITAYAPDLANFGITTSNEKLAGPQSTFKVSEINKILNREGMMDNIRKSITDGTSSVPTPILDPDPEPDPDPNKTLDKSSITKENVREIFFDGNFTTLARVMKFAKKPELQNILSKDSKDYKQEDIKEVSTKLNNFAKELNKVENLNFKQFIKFDKNGKLESTSLRDLIKLLKLYYSSEVTSPEVTSSEVTETTTQKIPSPSNQGGGKMKAFRKQQSQKKEKQFNEAIKEDKEKREKLKILYKRFITTKSPRLKNSLKTQINNKIKELSLTADEGVELYDTDNYKSLKTYLGL
tara:strand:+ start:1406 stop:3211 length:1806 start_codon:yes stop_codon:yes gene_type:complete